jgi:hypothetical protein
MGVCARRLVVPLLMFLGGWFAGPALAAGPAGADPSSNYPIGAMPAACQTDPTGSVCIDAAVTYLNDARANLGQPPYRLPADFAALTPTQQALILTNEDRILYNLAPISGLTDALNQDAAATLATDSDPQPSASDDWAGYTSNASWGTVNMVAAYEGWMYADGPGSDNVDCTTLDPSGCWGHRHDILWQFGPGTLAMGAAVGPDSSGKPAYTMLLMEGGPSYTPVFTYTWDQAVADGAESASASSSNSPVGPSGSGSAAVPLGAGEAGARITVKLVRIRGHRVTVKVAGASGTRVRCLLTRARGHFTRARSCTRTVTFSRVPTGRYQLRVTSGLLTVTRRLRVR